MRFISSEDLARTAEVMRLMRVDPYGIKLMLPKSRGLLLKISGLSCICANILKQEMLSFGGDAAVPRSALSGGKKKTDCLLIGNLSQFNRLQEKLALQPFGLSALAEEIRENLDNYCRRLSILRLGKYKLPIGSKKYVMGILNLTPDSFSGDGLYRDSCDYSAAVERAARLAADGADIIDIGGESSRPGSRAVPLKEELRRVIPVVKKIASSLKVPVSIDTRKPEVARRALDNGAVMINDIGGMRDKAMLKYAGRYKAGVVLMHMRGTPATMQKFTDYSSVVDEVNAYLSVSLDEAVSGGINAESIVVDPGIGFAKDQGQNIELLREIGSLRSLGRPLLLGASRKAFIGKILDGKPARERDNASVAVAVLAAAYGADILRVHDVKNTKEALKVTEAIIP